MKKAIFTALAVVMTMSAITPAFAGRVCEAQSNGTQQCHQEQEDNSVDTSGLDDAANATIVPTGDKQTDAAEKIIHTLKHIHIHF